MTAVPNDEARGAFTIDDRQDDPTEFSGGNLNRARWAKVLTGEIEGSSVVHLLLCQRENGPAAYVGIEDYAVTVKGRTGTFMLLHAATMFDGDHQATWSIVPGSGTGDLAGISGAAEITPAHDFILRYSLPA